MTTKERVHRLCVRLAATIERVSHQRRRTGVKPSKPGTYVQFTYACKPNCARCELDAALAELERE